MVSPAALLPWGGNILYLTGVSSVFDLTASEPRSVASFWGALFSSQTRKYISLDD